MFGLLALRQKRVAPLAHDCTEGMIGCRNSWRTLPCADASAVDECSVGMPIMAWTFKNFGDDLLRVSCHQRRRVNALALLPVERLIDEKVELDVSARLPQCFDGVEDFELDSDVLFGALRK